MGFGEWIEKCWRARGEMKESLLVGKLLLAAAPPMMSEEVMIQVGVQ